MHRPVGDCKHDHELQASPGNRRDEKSTESCEDKFERLLGFRISQLSSVDGFVKLMTRPMDPACLGVMRFVFGLLMLLDAVQERGMSRIRNWDDPDRCDFPLFDFLRPLPVQWMVLVFICMAMGAIGVMIGLFFRLSSLMFVIPYWYLFLLDKSRWNNHSYLFGLTGVLLMVSDANRYWSVDGLIWPRKRHTHVPLWNYSVLRIQFFLVYFLAGLKKLDMDWVAGYSLRRLGDNWVFFPFQLFLTTEQIDLYLIHVVGLIFDLSIGYFLFFDLTRPVAMLFCGSFHLMNSQMFSIGMFPWTMIATMPLFCYADWPRRLIRKLPRQLDYLLPSDRPLQPSPRCVYHKEQVKPEEDADTETYIQQKEDVRSKPTRYHKFSVLMITTYLAWQCFMPYSHFITKGYNSWTQGLYGYSWDMMIHTWSVQHVKITYLNKDNGEVGYLKPGVGTTRGRWSSQPDMMKQYARCLAGKLERDYNVTNPAIYFDIWRSMNKRFQQRMVDPRVDILTAPWHPFTDTPWVLPVLSDFSEWRMELKRIREEINDVWDQHRVVFVADFPGLSLDLYIQEDFKNASIKLLHGSVAVEVGQKKNHSLALGETFRLPPGLFHTFYTLSDRPSCYMIVYTNNTRLYLHQIANHYEQILNKTSSLVQASEEDIDALLSEMEGEDKPRVREILLEKRSMLLEESQQQATIMKPFQIMANFISKKSEVFATSFQFASAGIESVITGRPFREILPDDDDTDDPMKAGKQ